MKSWNHLKIINYNPYSVKANIPLLRRKGYITCDNSLIDQYFYPKSFVAPPMHWIYDRTCVLPHFLPIKAGLAPMPSYDPSFSKSFDDVMFERADELLAMGKRINIFWSGGIDSTTMFCALYHRVTDPSQLRIVCSADSIVESGSFFDRFIKYSGVDYIIYHRTSRERFYQKYQFNTETEIFVDGAPADQVYGNQLFYSPHWMPDKLDHHWEDAAQHCVPQDTIDFLKPCVEGSEYPIKLYREFLFWYKLNFSWYCHRGMFLIGTPSKYYPLHYKFYDSPNIQRWAMINAPRIIEQLPEKMPQRMLIYNLTNFSEYPFMKQRYRSGGATHYRSFMFTLEDGTMVYTNDIANGENYVDV